MKTVLDDSIGCAVWFASRGEGILGNGPNRGAKYTSTARVTAAFTSDGHLFLIIMYIYHALINPLSADMEL